MIYIKQQTSFFGNNLEKQNETHTYTCMDNGFANSKELLKIINFVIKIYVICGIFMLYVCAFSYGL